MESYKADTTFNFRVPHEQELMHVKRISKARPQHPINTSVRWFRLCAFLEMVLWNHYRWATNPSWEIGLGLKHDICSTAKRAVRLHGWRRRSRWKTKADKFSEKAPAASRASQPRTNSKFKKITNSHGFTNEQWCSMCSTLSHLMLSNVCLFLRFFLRHRQNRLLWKYFFNYISIRYIKGCLWVLSIFIHLK